jgi:OOP family OmpA-OmpF porin
MNKKLLCAALLGGLSLAQVASAQDFDDRWYVTGSTGFNLQDSQRDSRNAPFVAIGLGKFINPYWSIDGELNYQNPNRESNQNLNWSQYGISFDARRHFITEGRNWNPYGLIGLGYQREEIEHDNFPNPDSPFEETVGGAALKLGLGLQGDIGRVKIRTELAYRANNAIDNSESALRMDDPPPERNDGPDWFGDVLASVGIVIPLGPEPMLPVGPAPVVAPSCADMDSDGDGVNDCIDKCPDSQPGQTIGPDGCPVPVSIDLKGVNFDFDRATLRPDARAILSEAVEILRRYPELRVEVAGHTDECGTDQYNQGLSQRRARAVYDFLTSNGIDSSRLSGPNGYGESRPLENLGDAFPGCKSETNRRTELNTQ